METLRKGYDCSQNGKLESLPFNVPIFNRDRNVLRMIFGNPQQFDKLLPEGMPSKRIYD